MRAILRTSTLVLALITPMVMIAGCGGDDPAPIAASPDEPLKLGDDSPLDQLGADPGQN
ncbi:hypothetical protein [Tautonia marina]|uniref:hypothetical protein n=1 Tax=Tautonia marina TaxID=2653855 RepID=UPI0013754377|nr:hypothetical protein [Tautonia marina]